MRDFFCLHAHELKRRRPGRTDPLHTLRLSAQPSTPSKSSQRDGSANLPAEEEPHGADLSNGPFGASIPAFVKTAGRTRSGSIRTERKRERFAKTLRGRGSERGGGVDPSELRKLAWAGIPEELRPIAWQMLLVSPPISQSVSRGRTEDHSATELSSVAYSTEISNTAAET